MLEGVHNAVASHRPDVPSESPASGAHNSEHTLGGKLVGAVRDLWSGPARDQTQQERRAHQNDMIAEVVADSAAMLPGPRLLAAATFRMLVRSAPDSWSSAPMQALATGVKDFAEGAALHKLGKLGMSESPTVFPSTFSSTSLIASQSGRLAAMGFGTGAIQSFDHTSFRDSSGALTAYSTLSGLTRVLEAGTVGATLAVPMGLAATRLASAAAGRIASYGLATEERPVVWGITDRMRTTDGLLSSAEAGHGEIQYYRYSPGNNKLVFLSENRIFKEVAAAARRQGESLGIYIPGVRNAPGEAAIDAARLSQRSQLPVVVLDWASSNKSAGLLAALQQVRADFRSSVQSQPMINAGLSRLVESLNGQKIMFAHSHGADKAIEAGAWLARRGLAVDHTILVHPDIDITRFATAFSEFHRGTGPITVTTSQGDRALGAHNYLWSLVGPEAATPRRVTLDNGTVLRRMTLGSMPLHEISGFMKEVARAHVPDPDAFVAATEDAGPGWLRHGLDFESLASHVAKIRSAR